MNQDKLKTMGLAVLTTIGTVIFSILIVVIITVMIDMLASLLLSLIKINFFISFKTSISNFEEYIMPVAGLTNHLISGVNLLIYLCLLCMFSVLMSLVWQKLFLSGAVIHIVLLSIIIFTGIKVTIWPASYNYRGHSYTVNYSILNKNGKSFSITSQNYCVYRPHKIFAYGIHPNLPTPFCRIETSTENGDMIQIWRGWSLTKSKYLYVGYSFPDDSSLKIGEKMVSELSPYYTYLYTGMIKQTAEEFGIKQTGVEVVNDIKCAKMEKIDQNVQITLWYAIEGDLPIIMKTVFK